MLGARVNPDVRYGQAGVVVAAKRRLGGVSETISDTSEWAYDRSNGQLDRQDPPVVGARQEAGRPEARFRRAVRRSLASTDSALPLRRERYGSRAGERGRERGEDAEVGMERNPVESANAGRAESVLVLQASERSFHGA